MPFPSLFSPAPPTLKIEFSEGDNNVMFLYPSIASEDTPIGDTIVAGNVILSLPTPRNVKLVTVELVGQQQYEFRNKARTIETLRKAVTVDIDEQENREALLPAGEHTFAFSFNVPANVAPSLGNFGRTRYDVNVRIPNLGRLGGPLFCTRRIGLFVNHSGRANGFPPPHLSEKQWCHDRFGPTRIELNSKHFMIGGYLRWTITWVEYLLPFKIIDLTVELVQAFTVRPSLDVVEPLEHLERSHSLYKLNEDETWPDKLRRVIRPGDEPAITSRQTRIPYNQAQVPNRIPQLNPSHHPASQSCVMPSVAIVFTLIYEQYEGGQRPTQEQLNRPSRQKLQMRTDAILSSCFLRREYMELPTYDDAKGDKSAPTCSSHYEIPKGIFGFSQCMCKEMSREEEQEYGVSQEEMNEQSQAAEAAQAWLESSRAAKADPDG